ncbi:hypothetical protein Bca52824_064379 [Brassica carinata]|uniref:Uncharacterized protein n=1 Tax=Brassica carinata TaxID=52824 RepID=A0A8X7QG81_BRACI|nr:hypothetical protein Bca52824_064379 [Brassica carinata]
MLSVDSGKEAEVEKVNELQMEVYPALVELASNISTLNLEHVRSLQVGDGIGHLMDDDDDMAEMYVSEKKRKIRGSCVRGARR